jgi:ArsR family transcriptional regulator
MSFETEAPIRADLETDLKALANARRLDILDWLKDPVANFPKQEVGDPIADGICNVFIASKLGISQPSASRHLKCLVDAGLLIATPRKGWTYYRRNDPVIESVAAAVARI